MAERNRFYLYKEYKSFTDDMTDEEAGILFKIILRYENGEEIGEVPAEVKGAWSFIKKRSDNMREAYERRCESNHDAAVKRYEAERNGTKSTKRTKRNETLRNVQNVTISTKCKNLGTDNDNDTDTDIDIDIKGKGTPTAESLISESGLSESLKEKLRQWLTYKRERREAYKPSGLKSLLSVVKRHEEESGTEAVISLIDLCMSSNYKGIIWDRLAQRSPAQNPKIHSMPERTMDFKALEQSLIKNA